MGKRTRKLSTDGMIIGLVLGRHPQVLRLYPTWNHNLLRQQHDIKQSSNLQSQVFHVKPPSGWCLLRIIIPTDSCFFRGVDGVGIPPTSAFLCKKNQLLADAGRVAGPGRLQNSRAIAVEKMGATCGIESEIYMDPWDTV